MSDIDAALAAAETIRGDLRNLMIGALVRMEKRWTELPETEQLALAQIIDAHAQSIVGRIALLTMSKARPHVLVTLDGLTIGEVCKGTITMTKETAAALVPFAKQTVALHVINAEYFMGESRPAPTEPDQRPLPMGEAAGGGAGGFAEAPATVVEPGKAKTIIIVGPSTTVHTANSEAEAEREDRTERPVGGVDAAKMDALRGPRSQRKKPGPKPKANGAAKPRTGSPFA